MSIGKRIALAIIVLVILAMAVVSRTMDRAFVERQEEPVIVEESPTYIPPTPVPTPEPVEEPVPVSMYAGQEVQSSFFMELSAQRSAPERPWMYDDNLSAKENIYIYLTEEGGLNSAAACGILGNMAYETGWTFDPEADGGISYGLCQWLGKRLDKLYSWCAENDKDYTTIQGQLDFLLWELQYDDPYGTWDHLCSVTDNADGAYSAGHYFCYWFERPLDLANQSRYRAYEALKMYNELN